METRTREGLLGRGKFSGPKGAPKGKKTVTKKKKGETREEGKKKGDAAEKGGKKNSRKSKIKCLTYKRKRDKKNTRGEGATRGGKGEHWGKGDFESFNRLDGRSKNATCAQRGGKRSQE